MSVRVSVCLSVCFCLSMCLSMCQYVSVSTSPVVTVCASVHDSVCLSLRVQLTGCVSFTGCVYWLSGSGCGDQKNRSGPTPVCGEVAGKLIAHIAGAPNCLTASSVSFCLCRCVCLSLSFSFSVSRFLLFTHSSPSSPLCVSHTLYLPHKRCLLSLSARWTDPESHWLSE